MRAWKQLVVVVAASTLIAFAWWRFFPEPPLPDWLLIAVSPIVQITMPGNVHSAEEMLGFLGIWVYVLTASILLWGSWRVAQRKVRAQI